MGLPKIELRSVSKQFTLRHNQPLTFKDAALQLLSKGKSSWEKESFWALKDINLEVYEGEIVGILGLNGAGKSTLLRVIAQTMRCSEGDVIIRGQVTSLLSLGLGFHAEMTGKENIYLNTAFYGFTKARTDAIYEDILSFSELHKFIDVPVKTYSSGMRVRLGFSIAVHLNPEIMVIDEVLSAGDKEFQKKSSLKMKSLINEGRTVVLASHNLGMIQQLCHKAYLLQDGRVELSGPADEVVEAYKTQRQEVSRGQKQVAYTI